jgi:hypothetical protein
MTQRHSPAVPVGSDLSRLASLGERLRQAAEDLTALVCGDGDAPASLDGGGLAAVRPGGGRGPVRRQRRRAGRHAGAAACHRR